MFLLLILYVVMGYALDYETLMDSLLNIRSPLTIKHNSPSLILRHSASFREIQVCGIIIIIFLIKWELN